MLRAAKSFLYLLLVGLSVAPHAWAEPETLAAGVLGY